MAKKKNQKPVELRGRGSWGDIKPITKIIPDKRRKKPKYKREDD